MRGPLDDDVHAEGHGRVRFYNGRQLSALLEPINRQQLQPDEETKCSGSFIKSSNGVVPDATWDRVA